MNTAISRNWRAFALQPHRQENFKLSRDPLFIDILNGRDRLRCGNGDMLALDLSDRRWRVPTESEEGWGRWNVVFVSDFLEPPRDVYLFNLILQGKMIRCRPHDLPLYC
jgi:hypothetical protein